MLECVIASIRFGWDVQGYECRLYARGDLCYSKTLRTNAQARADADDLLAVVVRDKLGDETLNAIRKAFTAFVSAQNSGPLAGAST